MSRRLLAAILLAIAVLLLSACSLAGDVTPPPGSGPIATSPASAPPTAVVADVGYPSAPPVAANGGLLFLEHCEPCHGPAGAGGGSMAANLPTQPPDMSDPAFVLERTPASMFTAITQGNLDALMPPFGESLAEAERWSLVAFIYTLSTPPDQLEAGQAVFTANCAACHGATGQGDGPDAAGLAVAVPDFTDLPYMITRSQLDFFTLVSGGDDLHSFAETLTEPERWAAVDAVRAYSYAYAPPSDLLAERLGAITGQVVNGTAGGAAPAGLEVNLHSFDEQSLLETLTTTTAADGSFAFDAVAYVPGRQFLLSATYADITYGSDVASFGAAGEPLSMSLPVYERTTDASVLAVEQMHMFLEFINPGAVTVGQLYIFSNTSDKTYASDGANLLQFNLPAGAEALDVQNGVLDQDYFRNPDGFGALWQVQPGASGGQILFSFQLPYDEGLSFRQVMHYPVVSVNVLVSNLSVSLSGPDLLDLGPQDFQGTSFQNFSHGGLAAGETFAFEMSGAAGASTGGDAGQPALVTGDSTGLAIGLGALAVALLGIGVWLYRRPARPDPARLREDLLQALVELDDAYEAGEVARDDYLAERAQLKADLIKVWDGGD